MANELKWAQEHFEKYNPRYHKYQKYYDGDHQQILSDEVRSTFGRLFGCMRDNLCPPIVDELADRLILTGVSVDDTDEASAEFFGNLWETQRLSVISADIHSDAVLHGDKYVIVWPDVNGVPRIYPQERGLIAVRYDDSGEEPVIVEAVKCWVLKYPNSNRYYTRLNHYLPDRLYRYYKDGNVGCPSGLAGWKLYDTDGIPAVSDNPFNRVPVFRFANSLKQHVFARSELKDVTPLQDALNKSVIDLLIGSEFQGLPQRYAAGVSLMVDPDTGKEIPPFQVGKQRIWVTEEENAKFGEFSAGNLAQLIQVVDNFRMEIARVSRTPVHLLMMNSGDFPSGEALRTAEAPMLTKVDKRQTVWGAVWEDIFMFAAEIAKFVPAGDIDATWKDVTPHSEKEQAETGVLKVSLGVSKKQVQRELGYSKADIEKMDAENDEAQRKAQENMIQMFNTGDANNPPPRDGSGSQQSN